MTRFDELDENVARMFSEYKKADDTRGFNPLDFIHVYGSPVFALLYSRLFWPTFVEVDGMVFLGSTVEDSDDVALVRNAFEHFKGDKTKTEKAFNLVEVPALFGGRSGDTSEEQDLWLAEILAEMWKWRLRARFPSRRFVIRVVHPEESGVELGVLFCQDRN